MTGTRRIGALGSVRILVCGAFPDEFLNQLVRQGVSFWGYHKIDPLTVTMFISRKDLNVALLTGKRTMCEVELRESLGPLPRLKAMGERLIYMLFLGLLLLGILHFQNRLLFFTVEGNETIPTERILQILDENGVSFGIDGQKLDMNILKNSVLAQIPELGYLTINQEGPFAQVVVREREGKPSHIGRKGPANLVADKDGILDEITVLNGTAQVKKGDVVSRGQLLISGITNLDKVLMLSRAEGETIARTFLRKEALLSTERVAKAYTGREKTVFSVTFGKNKINFYKSSGISYKNYDRITLIKPLTLPWGLQLPFSLHIITLREYAPTSEEMRPEEAQAVLNQALLRDVQESLNAGMILNSRLVLKKETDRFCLGGVLECRENIGRLVEIQD